MPDPTYERLKILLQTITDLVNSKGLAAEIQPDVRSVQGQVIWERRVCGQKRSLRIAPVRETYDPVCEFTISWYVVGEGGLSTGGNWVGTLEHTIEAFSRFLIDGEDLKPWEKFLLEVLPSEME